MLYPSSKEEETMKRRFVSALPADPVRGVKDSGSSQVTRRPNRVRPRTLLASGFVLLALAFSGCGGDTANDEVSPEDPGTVEQSGYEQGYQAGYVGCEGYSPRQVAREFGGSSEEPKAAAEGFADSFEPETRQGAYEGCYDGLLGRAPRVQ
jgi:hypothetical protein